MRKRQLRQLIASFRAETGQSMKVSIGSDQIEADKELLNRVQQMLYEDYEWPFFKVQPTKVLAVGQRFYDPPAELPVENIEAIYRWESGKVREPALVRGIDLVHLAAYNSDNDERADPVERWDIRWTGTSEQIEVWPIPLTQGVLQFIGRRALRPMIDDGDECEIDGSLIVLYAAADRLARQGSKNADAVLTAAARLKQRLQAAAGGNRPPVRIGGMVEPARSRQIVIRVSGAA